MSRWGLLLFLLLGLSACRYTFLPLDPGRPPPPFPGFLQARLEPQGGVALLRLTVHRLERPDYLLLRWYREETLVLERALFLEAPGAYTYPLPLGEGYHRLWLLWEGEPLLQLDLGEPSLPE